VVVVVTLVTVQPVMAVVEKLIYFTGIFITCRQDNEYYVTKRPVLLLFNLLIYRVIKHNFGITKFFNEYLAIL